MSTPLGRNDVVTIPAIDARVNFQKIKDSAQAIGAISNVLIEDMSYHGSEPSPRFSPVDIEGLAVAAKLIADGVLDAAHEIDPTAE